MEFRERLSPFARSGQSGDQRSPNARPRRRWDRFTTQTSDTPIESPAAPARARERIRKAVFVGLGRATEQIGLEGGGWLRVVSAADARRALDLIGEFAPHLVVASMAVFDGMRGGLLGAVLERYPGFRSPVILVDLDSDRQGLTICRWSAARGGFEEQPAPLERLGDEIERLCSSEVATPRTATQIQNIGFYNVVERQGQTIHVQTEAVVSDKVEIRTVVLRNGAILDVRTQTCSSPEDRLLADSTAAAESQHDATLDLVKRGMID